MPEETPETGTLKFRTRVVDVSTDSWSYRRGGRFTKSGVTVQFDEDGKAVTRAENAPLFDPHPEFEVGKVRTVTEEVEVDADDPRLEGNKTKTIDVNPEDSDSE